MPVVSIIIPAFRAQAAIARAVRSLLRQSIDDWETIVVADDGADYAALLRGSGIDDRRIRFVSTDRTGSGCHHARNVGLAVANGDFIAALDADDVFLPSRLATLLPVSRKHGAAADNFRVVDDVTGHEIGRAFHGHFAKLSLDTAALLDTTVPIFPMVAREYAEPRLEGIEYGEDVVANLRLIDRIGSLTVIGASLSEYRVVPGSLSNNDRSAEKFEQSYSDLIERLSRGDRLGLAPKNAMDACEGLSRKRDFNRAFAAARMDNPQLNFQTFAAQAAMRAQSHTASRALSRLRPPAGALSDR